MALSVILNAKKDSQESLVYVGVNVLQTFLKQFYSVQNLNPMVEELVMHFGMKISVKVRPEKCVRKMGQCGILNVTLAFMQLDAALVLQIVHLDLQILE